MYFWNTFSNCFKSWCSNYLDQWRLHHFPCPGIFFSDKVVRDFSPIILSRCFASLICCLLIDFFVKTNQIRLVKNFVKTRHLLFVKKSREQQIQFCFLFGLTENVWNLATLICCVNLFMSGIIEEIAAKRTKVAKLISLKAKLSFKNLLRKLLIHYKILLKYFKHNLLFSSTFNQSSFIVIFDWDILVTKSCTNLLRYILSQKHQNK